MYVGFDVCWWDERKGRMQLFGGTERKDSRNRAGPWLCSLVFPAAVHVESCWVFQRHVFRKFEGRRGKEKSEKLVAWNWAWPVEVVQTRRFRRKSDCICNMGRTSRDEGHSTVGNQGMYGIVLGLGHFCIDSVKLYRDSAGFEGGCSRAWIR